MKALAKRVERLQRRRAAAVERDYVQNPRDHFRMVVSRMDRPLNLETSRCARTLSADGTLTELVRLDGIRGDLSNEELERFVARFPVQK
jgi:hypothetical protein